MAQHQSINYYENQLKDHQVHWMLGFITQKSGQQQLPSSF